MEATLFSHWIFRHLKTHAARLEMGHPARMKAISVGKKKSDKLDARTLADLLRADLFPAYFVMPPELEGLRRQMRFRRLVAEERSGAVLLDQEGREFTAAWPARCATRRASRSADRCPSSAIATCKPC